MSDASEQHRHACECRLVASWPLERRNRFLIGVQEKRGASAALKLTADVAELVRKRSRNFPPTKE